MEDIITEISAFNFYRTPPSVLSLFEEPRVFVNPKLRRWILKDSTIENLFGFPLHTVVQNRNQLANSKSVIQHLWTADFPSGSLRAIENLGTVTSPEMTLFLLSRSKTVGETAMAMYEMCGGYSCYSMPRNVKELKEIANGEFLSFEGGGFDDAYSILDDDAGWHQVLDFNRQPIDLWTRPALTTIEDLQSFTVQAKGTTGIGKFKRALKFVKGYALSPFEARAAIMLGASTKDGGYGLDIKLNQKIDYNKQARRISGHEFAIADILITSPDGTKWVDVECQGAVIHTGNKAGVDDARRTASVEAMGISVVPLTFDQLKSDYRCDAIVELICQKLGIKMRPKTKSMKKEEEKLRREIFVLWD